VHDHHKHIALGRITAGRFEGATHLSPAKLLCPYREAKKAAPTSLRSKRSHHQRARNSAAADMGKERAPLVCHLVA